MDEVWQNLVIHCLELFNCIADDISVQFIDKINSGYLKKRIWLDCEPIQIHIFHLHTGYPYIYVLPREQCSGKLIQKIPKKIKSQLKLKLFWGPPLGTVSTGDSPVLKGSTWIPKLKKSMGGIFRFVDEKN